MDRGSFSLFLQSNMQNNLFPDNSCFAFRNTLPTGIDFKEYCVGLESAYFTDDYYRYMYESFHYDDRPKLAKNFFDTSKGDNNIKIHSTTGSRTAILKLKEKLDRFLIKSNLILKQQNYPLHFGNVLNGPSIIGITINNLALPHIHWMMDENLARLFGFSSTVVGRAATKSDFKLNIVNVDGL